MRYREYAGSSRVNAIYPKRSRKKVFTLKMNRRQARDLARNLNRAARLGWDNIEISAHRKKGRGRKPGTKDTFPVSVIGPLLNV